MVEIKHKILVIILIGLLCTIGLFILYQENQGCLGHSEQQIAEKDLIKVKVEKGMHEMLTGKIKEIKVRDGKRSLLIEDEKDHEYIFHINEHTIVLTFEKLKEGQDVDIIFNGILTRSIPPQGNAIIVNGLKL